MYKLHTVLWSEQDKADYNKMTLSRKLTGKYAVVFLIRRGKSRKNCFGLIKNVRIESERGTSQK